MNAFETPEPTNPSSHTAPSIPVSTVVVGPASTSLPLSQLKTVTRPPATGADDTVTLQNAESGVTLHIGQRFLLDLGTREWQIRVNDKTIVRAVLDSNTPTVGRSYYEALKPGKTRITATSDPPCRKTQPPCMLPTLFLEIPVTVLP